MNQRLQELLNRKPSKWGNLSIKTFEKDISLLQTVVKESRQEAKQIKDAYKKKCEEIDVYIQALRAIDTYIGSTSESIPYIKEILKQTLPEYKE